MKGLRMGLVRVIVPLCLISLFAGCGLFNQYANLSPVNKAIVTASQLTAWYQATYKSVNDLYVVSTPTKQLWLKKNVNPNMNKVKKLIVGYVDSVNLWKKTGMEPLNLPSVVDQINVLCSDIITSLGGA
jgi:hypothetical protein